MRVAIIIPNYNHTHAIERTLETLEPLGLPVFLVNDGSNEAT